MRVFFGILIALAAIWLLFGRGETDPIKTRDEAFKDNMARGFAAINADPDRDRIMRCLTARAEMGEELCKQIMAAAVERAKTRAGR